MRISVSDAKAKLTDLVRRAQAGDEVILTRHGEPAARIVAEKRTLDPEELRSRRRAAVERAIAEARARGPDGGPCAARAADYLYDENGLPA